MLKSKSYLCSAFVLTGLIAGLMTAPAMSGEIMASLDASSDVSTLKPDFKSVSYAHDDVHIQAHDHGHSHSHDIVQNPKSKTLRRRGWTDEAGYQKPGAAVRFSHDYAGRQITGQAQLINLQFSEGYDQGQLKIELRAPDALMLTGGGVYEFDMQGQDSHDLSLSVKSDMAGQHYVNIFATVTFPNGQMSARSFALNIDSVAPGLERKELGSAKGVSAARQQPEPLSGELPKALGGQLIIMRAQETVY